MQQFFFLPVGFVFYICLFTPLYLALSSSDLFPPVFLFRSFPLKLASSDPRLELHYVFLFPVLFSLFFFPWTTRSIYTFTFIDVHVKGSTAPFLCCSLVPPSPSLSLFLSAIFILSVSVCVYVCICLSINPSYFIHQRSSGFALIGFFLQYSDPFPLRQDQPVESCLACGTRTGGDRYRAGEVIRLTVFLCHIQKKNGEAG